MTLSDRNRPALQLTTDDDILRRICRSPYARLIGRGLPADHPDLPAALDTLDARLDRQETTP